MIKGDLSFKRMHISRLTTNLRGLILEQILSDSYCLILNDGTPTLTGDNIKSRRTLKDEAEL
ncbi:hypothetical protein BpHYR1_035119 [Brachionus plicatilis]|uniref:Uncharacterized protein n=1 Tax=Brachionus plicatilis TaxID=10195 RepID=A0A3M7RJ14_BRAPC|nr:hypothetical protein BpHYR1_035119 [Brachionus plicatilis]